MKKAYLWFLCSNFRYLWTNKYFEIFTWCLWLQYIAKKIEKFEDTKGVIRNPKLKKYRQYNGQKKKVRWTNNNLQNTTLKTIDWTTCTPQKTVGEHKSSFNLAKLCPLFSKKWQICGLCSLTLLSLYQNPWNFHTMFFFPTIHRSRSSKRNFVFGVYF